MEVTATAKFIRIAPRRARLVARRVKGMTPEEALAALAFVPHRAAAVIAQVVKSAAANAESNYGLDRDTLTVRVVRVDEGPSLRRMRPKARGRAGFYRRRSSHITVVVDDGSE
jgi:large subunit ribosomal protein L22